MNLREIQTIARRLGIKPGKLDKATLIRAVQRAEGNFDCYGSARSGYCDRNDCLWRRDCFATAKKGLSG